jgi:hypothetical protein
MKLKKDKRLLLKDMTPEILDYVEQFKKHSAREMGKFIGGDEKYCSKRALAIRFFIQRSLHQSNNTFKTLQPNHKLPMILKLLKHKHIDNYSKYILIYKSCLGYESFMTWSMKTQAISEFPELSDAIVRLIIERDTWWAGSLMANNPYYELKPFTIYRLALINTSLIAQRLSWDNHFRRKLFNAMSVEQIHTLFLMDPKKFSTLLKPARGYYGEILFTDDFIHDMIMKSPTSIRRMPRERLTYDLCLRAVSCSGSLLQYVPNEIKDQKLCDIACSSVPSAIKYTPHEFKNIQIAMKHQLRGKNTLKYMRKKIQEATNAPSDKT